MRVIILKIVLFSLFFGCCVQAIMRHHAVEPYALGQVPADFRVDGPALNLALSKLARFKGPAHREKRAQWIALIRESTQAGFPATVSATRLIIDILNCPADTTLAQAQIKFIELREDLEEILEHKNWLIVQQLGTVLKALDDQLRELIVDIARIPVICHNQTIDWLYKDEDAPLSGLKPVTKRPDQHVAQPSRAAKIKNFLYNHRFACATGAALVCYIIVWKLLAATVPELQPEILPEIAVNVTSVATNGTYRNFNPLLTCAAAGLTDGLMWTGQSALEARITDKPIEPLCPDVTQLSFEARICQTRLTQCAQQQDLRAEPLAQRLARAEQEAAQARQELELRLVAEQAATAMARQQAELATQEAARARELFDNQLAVAQQEAAAQEQKAVQVAQEFEQLVATVQAEERLQAERAEALRELQLREQEEVKKLPCTALTDHLYEFLYLKTIDKRAAACISYFGKFVRWISFGATKQGQGSQ